MPSVRLEGTPYRQGYVHGRAFQDLIRLNQQVLRSGIERLSARGRPPQYADVVRRAYGYARSRRPELQDELQGIADGAGLPLEDILMVNFPAVTLLGLVPMECTQVLVPGHLARDGVTRLGKTRDVSASRNRNVVLHRVLDGGRETIEITHAGSLAMVGSAMNDAGLMLSTSGVWSKRTTIGFERADEAWLGSTMDPVIQRCETVDDVTRAIEAEPRLTNLNVVVADASGAAAALEIAPDSVYRHDIGAGGLVRTNHFRAQELADRAPSREEYESTYTRYERACDAFASHGADWTEDALWALLGDHEGGPERCICRHSDDEHGHVTVYGSVSSWPTGAMESWTGHPCERVALDGMSVA